MVESRVAIMLPPSNAQCMLRPPSRYSSREVWRREK